MLQDQSRNRTPMPAAQPPAGAGPPGPGPARAEAGIARMLASSAASVPVPLSAVSMDLRVALEELAAADAAGWAETSDDDAVFDAHAARQDAADDAVLATPCLSLADVGAKLTSLIPRIRPDLLNKRHAEHLEAIRSDINQMLEPTLLAGGSGGDPLLAAIAAHREAEAAMKAFSVRVEDRHLTADDFAEERLLCRAQIDTRDAVWAIAPTTPIGRAALVQFVRDEIAASGTAEGGPPDDDHPIWRDGLRALVAAQGETDLRPGDQSGEDPIFAAIEEHESAYAAWLPLARAVNETPITDPAYDLAVAAAEVPEQREFEAYNGLFKTAPTTFGGLAALAHYLPDLIRHNAASGIGADSDALKALVTVCSAIGGIACSAEAAISLALRGLGGGAFGVAAPLEDRRTRTDKYLSMMEVDGFVPYPADNPRCLMAIELAIPLEAERLLALAQDEFDRCAEAYADFPTPERDGHLARLRAEYRLDELADVVRGRAAETDPTASAGAVGGAA